MQKTRGDGGILFDLFGDFNNIGIRFPACSGSIRNLRKSWGSSSRLLKRRSRSADVQQIFGFKQLLDAS